MTTHVKLFSGLEPTLR